ncbi:nucleoside/nucleotide kinase family protein [Eubacterium ramulus]
MKKAYKYKVNGLETTAVYDDETVAKIFVPMLQKWSRLHQQSGRRVIIFLSAPPGVGKTTLAQFLEYLSKQETSVEEIQAVGLDGFHYHQEYILRHEICVDGNMIPMKEVKGCPETFDIEKLKKKLKSLKTGNTKWPVYDRNIHDVLEDAVEVEKEIVLIEGNWLLLQEKPWDELVSECDDSIFISADEKLLRERLVKRKMMGGLSREAAETFFEKSDCRNIRRLMTAHWQAGERWILTPEGDYEWIGGEHT